MIWKISCRGERGTELERESEVLERESGVKLYKNKKHEKRNTVSSLWLRSE